ncbi:MULTISPECIES: hypothetical protein [Bradyrhizobium]|jgi:hypothetical protein|uniref:hypothetical protein n=1 Tax=Bradyrhizobium TaxID=374 RepID=UPI0011AE292E|nr:MULTISPECIES: hypothetical protein [Bradyrhizobium]
MEVQIAKASGEIEFHFEKSRYFRVIHVDGAAGGFSPGNRNVHLAIFSERSPLPRTVVHNVADGVLGAEIESRRESKKGVFREIEADLVMSIETAIALREWLNERITESELISSMISEKK